MLPHHQSPVVNVLSVLLNEHLLTVAISPVRSAARTSTSLRVLAAVDRSTELKCCGPGVHGDQKIALVVILQPRALHPLLLVVCLKSSPHPFRV